MSEEQAIQNEGSGKPESSFESFDSSNEASSEQNNQTTNETNETSEQDSQAGESETTTPETISHEEQTQTNEKTQEQPEWFLSDKYRSVEEQAKALPELQKKMGKYWGPPKEGDYKLDDIEGVEENDPILENLKPALKEIGLSQEGFKELVSQYQKANIETMKSYEEKLKKELTENDAATYNAIDKWMQSNLTPEEKEQVQNNWLMTPEDFKLFNHLRLMAAPTTNVPSSNDAQTARFESSQEVENDKVKYRKDIKQGLRSPDKNYEAELAQRFRDARTREMRSQNKG